MPKDSGDEPAGVHKRMKRLRKGTKSCLPCRQRKIRCSGAGLDGSQCPECKARDDECIAQGVLDDDDPALKRRLRERVAFLESRLHHLTGENATGDRIPKKHETASEALRELLNCISSATRTNLDAAAQRSQRDEEEVETPSAPLVRLLNNPVFGATPDSSTGHGEDAPTPRVEQARLPELRYNSVEHYEAVRELCSYFPPEAEMLDIFDNESSWWSLYHDTLGLAWGGKDPSSLRSFAVHALNEGQAPMLGLLLVSFAISTGDQKYLPPVEKHILHNDHFAGTEYGLSCMMALGVCYMSSLQPRKAWTVYQRANTLLHLNGIHRQHRSERHEMLFWQLFHADRWCSLMIGLPYMSSDQFCQLQLIPPTKLAEVGTWLYRKLGIITGRVIDCLQDTKGPTLSAALLVEEQMESLRSQLPGRYLELADARNISDDAEKYTRLYRIIHFHQLRTYAHLPFFLRSATEDRYEFSRNSCIDDSRHLLEAFIALYEADPRMASNGSIINFTAFTAAVVVLLGLLGYGRPQTAGYVLSQARSDEDWKMIYRVLEAIKYGTQTKMAGAICRKCYTALELLLSSAQTSQDEPAKRIVLPYFGTLSITRRHHARNGELPRSLEQQRHGLSGPDSGAFAQRPWAESAHPQYQEAAALPEGTVPPQSLGMGMSVAYDGPFLHPEDPTAWMLDHGPGANGILGAGPGWFDDSTAGTDWNWLMADLPPHTAS